MTGKKNVCFFSPFFFFDVYLLSFFKKFTFSKPSESSRWGREVKGLDFPWWADTFKIRSSVFTKILMFLSAQFHFWTPVPFLSSMGGLIYTYMCVWGNAMSNKTGKKNISRFVWCAIPHVQHIRLISYQRRTKEERKGQQGNCCGKLKNKSALMHVQIKAWVGSRPARSWQTTATEMAVTGMFQRSDARRYILIHGRLAQDSQEVKTNKSNKPTSKQTTHQRRVDLRSRLWVCLSQSCSPRGVHTSVCICVSVCVCVRVWVFMCRPLHTFTGVRKTVLSWERKEPKSVDWGWREE